MCAARRGSPLGFVWGGVWLDFRAGSPPGRPIRLWFHKVDSLVYKEP